MTINWKTTALGIAVAVANIVANGGSPKQLALSSLLAALGIFAKDFNVTGK